MLHKLKIGDRTGRNLMQSFLRSISLGGTQALIVQLMLAYTLKQMLPEGQIIQPGAEFVSARQVVHPCLSRLRSRFCSD